MFSTLKIKTKTQLTAPLELEVVQVDVIGRRVCDVTYAHLQPEIPFTDTQVNPRFPPLADRRLAFPQAPDVIDGVPIPHGDG